jgi:choline dehydrogenase
MVQGGSADRVLRTIMPEFDYTVTGGGSAGCVPASRLTEDPSVCVLTIESGDRDDDKYIHIPRRSSK